MIIFFLIKKTISFIEVVFLMLVLKIYEKIYEKKKAKSGKKPVYNFVFGNVLGKKAVFLIQNIKALRVVDLAK